MFTHLPLEIRLQIWVTILTQPRTIYLTMRYLPDDPNDWCGTCSKGPEFSCIPSTLIPILLHLCSETRSLALKYYSLSFGRANPPILRLPGLRKTEFSWGDETWVSENWVHGNVDEVKRYEPKVYVNFERDTVVFGPTLLAHGMEGSGRFLFGFPYANHFEFEVLQRIERLGLSISTGSSLDMGQRVLYHLDRHVGLGKYQNLKKLYLCLGADDLDARMGVELVDLRGGEGMAEEFVRRWRTALKEEGAQGDSEGTEALSLIFRDGLSKRNNLRGLLLKNGASPDNVLQCVWVRERETRSG